MPKKPKKVKKRKIVKKSNSRKATKKSPFQQRPQNSELEPIIKVQRPNSAPDRATLAELRAQRFQFLQNSVKNDKKSQNLTQNATLSPINSQNKP